MFAYFHATNRDLVDGATTNRRKPTGRLQSSFDRWHMATEAIRADPVLARDLARSGRTEWPPEARAVRTTRICQYG